MGLKVNRSPFRLSELIDQDTDGNVMLKAHAYQAQSHGEVTARVAFVAGNDYIRAYVGTTSNPVGDGIRILENGVGGAVPTVGGGFSFLLAKGDYFEITTNSTSAASINWRSFGTLKKPIDFN